MGVTRIVFVTEEIGHTLRYIIYLSFIEKVIRSHHYNDGMNRLPGFTAETSVLRTERHLIQNTKYTASQYTEVIPARPIVVGKRVLRYFYPCVSHADGTVGFCMEERFEDIIVDDGTIET